MPAHVMRPVVDQRGSTACVPLMRRGAGPGGPPHAGPDQESCCRVHLERLAECRSTHFLNGLLSEQ